jgi:hypothetical protein
VVGFVYVIKFTLLHFEGFRVLRVSDFDKTVETLTGIRSVVEEFPFHMTVPLAGAPRHLAVNSDGSILSVCVSENGVCVIRLYDIQIFSDRVRICCKSKAQLHQRWLTKPSVKNDIIFLLQPISIALIGQTAELLHFFTDG